MSNLWREVLLASLRDSDAAHYIKTPDFETVATLAGLGPDAVGYAFNRGLQKLDKAPSKGYARQAA